MDFFKEFNLAKKLIIKAYKKILKKPIKNINEKMDKSFATNLDVDCENFIIKNVLKVFPNDNFLSEETNSKSEILERTWVLDPIDGTNCFIKGYPNWGIQLAFLYKNEVQFSIIYLPKLNQLFYGILKDGVYVNNKKLNNVNLLPLKLSVVEYVGSYKTDVGNLNKVYNAFKGKCLMQISPWAACYIFTNFAQGKSNIIVSDKLKPWDRIPGEFMVQLLGAKTIKITNEITIYSACMDEVLTNVFKVGKKNEL